MRRRDFMRVTGFLLAAGVVTREWIAARADDQPFDVYMTFDDGPSSARDFKSGPTDIVLQILTDADAPATFFLHGLHINDWDGPVMVRYIEDGHAIGNHLWRQGGNLIADNPAWALMGEQYLSAEVRIRDLLQKTDPAVYDKYMAQAKLFRRPGGNNGLDDFLNPKNFYDLAHEPYLRPYWDKIDWLNGVYDYSGWHVNGGESIPLKVRPQTPDEVRNFVLHGGSGYYGVVDYLQPQRSIEADQGLIILMHDADKDTDTMLPQLITDLRALGAQFKALPRPNDQPNAKTVGIGYAPTYPK
ncbi:MAG TPA: polysaccharide deacetylase family protein [Aggregatilineales bacterium]|nr:polysaccharide deacetylase family protein [Aggregatilineales bacterium]